MVRSRQSGDYITLADGRTKTVRRFMIDEKIPREKRDSVLLLADGSHILWIVGYRISEYYKVGPDTVSYTHLDVYKRQALKDAVNN